MFNSTLYEYNNNNFNNNNDFTNYNNSHHYHNNTTTTMTTVYTATDSTANLMDSYFGFNNSFNNGHNNYSYSYNNSNNNNSIINYNSSDNTGAVTATTIAVSLLMSLLNDTVPIIIPSINSTTTTALQTVVDTPNTTYFEAITPFPESFRRSSTSAYNATSHIVEQIVNMQPCTTFIQIHQLIVCLIALFGFVTNSLSIVVLNRDKNNHVAIFLLKSLAIFDNVANFIGLFSYFVIMFGLNRLDRRKFLLYYNYLVVIINPLATTAQSCVIWATVLLAINRYIALCKPFAAKKFLTMFWARMQVLIVVVALCILNAPFYGSLTITELNCGLNFPNMFKYNYSYNNNNNTFYSNNNNNVYNNYLKNNNSLFNNESFSNNFNIDMYYKSSTNLLRNNTNRNHNNITDNVNEMPFKLHNYNDNNYHFTFNPTTQIPIIPTITEKPFRYTKQNCMNHTVIQSTTFGATAFYKAYNNFFYNAVVLILPLFLLIGLNIPILIMLKKSQENMKRNSLGYRGKQEKNITIVMIIIIVQFILCHFPDRILIITKAFINQKQETCPSWYFYVYRMATVLVLLNSSSDFIIYYYFRKRFRAILNYKVCPCGRKRLQRNASLTDLDDEEMSVQRRYSQVPSRQNS